LSRRGLSISREGDSTTPLGSLFQGSVKWKACLCLVANSQPFAKRRWVWAELRLSRREGSEQSRVTSLREVGAAPLLPRSTLRRAGTRSASAPAAGQPVGLGQALLCRSSQATVSNSCQYAM